MRTAILLVGAASLASAFVLPAAPGAKRVTPLRMAAGGDEEWRQIVGSEANLRSYLGQNGFRYNLAKTETEIATEGDFSLWEKIWGGTSNNEARLRARADFSKVTIDQYDSKKAKEGKEWLAKYGYKRWGLPYLDKSGAGDAPAAAAPAVKAAPAAAKPSFSFGLPKSAPPKLTTSKPAASSPASSRPKISGTAVRVPATAAATPASKPAATPAAAPKRTFTASAPGKPTGNLNLLKKK